MNKAKTEKITKGAWKALPKDTKRRALQHLLGGAFREWLLDDDGMFFWDVISRSVHVCEYGNYKLALWGGKLFIH